MVTAFLRGTSIAGGTRGAISEAARARSFLVAGFAGNLSSQAVVHVDFTCFAVNDYLLLGRVAKLAPHSLNESLKRVIKVHFTQLSVYNQFIVFL